MINYHVRSGPKASHPRHHSKTPTTSHVGPVHVQLVRSSVYSTGSRGHASGYCPSNPRIEADFKRTDKQTRSIDRLISALIVVTFHPRPDLSGRLGAPGDMADPNEDQKFHYGVTYYEAPNDTQLQIMEK